MTTPANPTPAALAALDEFKMLLGRYTEAFRGAVEVEGEAGIDAPTDPDVDRAYERAAQRRSDLEAFVLALLAAARQGEETDYAIMEAIERTVKLCDQQERKRIPREAREVDYAGILAASKEAAAKRRAARAASQPEEVSRG